MPETPNYALQPPRERTTTAALQRLGSVSKTNADAQHFRQRPGRAIARKLRGHLEVPIAPRHSLLAG